MQLKLLGLDHKKANRIKLETPIPSVCLATTAGNSRTVKQKIDGNEDACLFLQEQNHQIFVIADAHFGAASANKGCEQFPELLKSFSPKSPAIQHYGAHLYLDQRLNQEENQSATTLISAQIDANQLLWVSSGDSKVFLVRHENILQLNEINPTMFLGPPISKLEHARNELEIPSSISEIRLITFLLTLSHLSHYVRNQKGTPEQIRDMINLVQKYAPQNRFSNEELLKPWHPTHLICLRTLPTWGTLNLEKGDRLLFATDGIDENVSGIAPDDLFRLTSQGSQPESICKHILKTMLKKGDDNCSLVFYEHR